jgi:hypothetical protein
MGETRNVYRILFSKPTRTKKCFGKLDRRKKVTLKCIVNNRMWGLELDLTEDAVHWPVIVISALEGLGPT